jgi:ribosomal-protein-alanine N-acetyltransferase
MEPDDVPAVIAIERLSFPTPWLASSFLYELGRTDRSFYYVLLRPAEEEESVSSERGWRRWLRGVVSLSGENRVVGYVGLRILSAEAHISTIAVHPEWRGRQLGELLLLTAMEQALGLGAGLVSLEVRASNDVAQHLYRKYGFRFKGVHRGYYRDGEDAWLMAVEAERSAYRTRLASLRQALMGEVCCRRMGIGQKNGDTL